MALPSPSPLTNRSILVTGGTGSFGKAFVRRALDVGARRVVVFSRDELKQSEMAAAFADDRLRFMLGTVSDQDRVRRAVDGVDYVVHAAAMKQVPACEQNPWEALQTNTNGARAVAAASIDADVLRAVYLSTDKAAAPNTLYGATKLAGERIWTQANVYAANRRTRLVATRYGNVIGSRGSVVPIFEACEREGRAAMLTDPGMTRFWMRLEHAVWLVELALAESRGGEVFVPKAGSCSIATVAEAVAPSCERKVIGPRAGEKKHEVLISEDESRMTFDHGSHYRIEPSRTWEYLPELNAPRLCDGWSYRSDTNVQRLSVDDVRSLVYGERRAVA